MVEGIAAGLLSLKDLDVLPRSAVCVAGAEIGLARPGPRVAILAPSGSSVMAGFEGESSALGDRTLVLGPTSAANLEALRALLPWEAHLLRHLKPFTGEGVRKERA